MKQGAMDHSRWRKMSEWMFLLVQAHLGSPG